MPTYLEPLAAAMDLWSRLTEKLLPVRDADGANLLRRQITERTGDPLAVSHFQLYDIYSSEAERRPLLAKAYLHLATHHLEKSVARAVAFPRPLLFLGRSQAKEGDLPEALKTLSEFIYKQRLLVQGVSSDDSERLLFCRGLALAASIRSQLGQFEPAHQWYAEALEQFRRVDTKARISASVLEDSILVGISTCLLRQFRYQEAQKFIDEVLGEQIFSEYQSSARHNLVISRDLLTGLVDATRDFQPVPGTEEVWGDLLEEVQRSKTPDDAREVRRKILDAVRTRRADSRIQDVAKGVLSAMNVQLSALESVRTPEDPPEEPAPEIKADRHVSDPGAETPEQKLARAVALLAEKYRENQKQRRALNRAYDEVARRSVLNSMEEVRLIADAEYRVPLRYQAAWLWWSTVRFVVRIVAIGYFLGKVFEDFLEKKGESLFERANIAHGAFILPVAVLLIGLVLDHFAEKTLDDWNLSRYKRLLTLIVANRSSRLWATYNKLRMALATTRRSLEDFDRLMKAAPSAGTST